MHVIVVCALEGRDIRASASASPSRGRFWTILDDPDPDSSGGFVPRCERRRSSSRSFDPSLLDRKLTRLQTRLGPTYITLHPLNSPRCCNFRKVRRIEVIIGLKLAEARADGELTRAGLLSHGVANEQPVLLQACFRLPVSP